MDGEPCIDGEAEIIESSTSKELVECQGDANISPSIDMEFESEEAAVIFYDAYAKRLGFGMRVDRRWMHDGKVIRRRLVCHKQGFAKSIPQDSRIRKPRANQRKGCKAMMMVKKETSGKWVVSRFEEEHNHPMVISSGKNRDNRCTWLLTETSEREKVRKRSREDDMDDKDRKIQELSTALQREKKLSASYQEQLVTVIKDVEQHIQHLSRKVQDIVQNVRDIECRKEYTICIKKEYAWLSE